ncbi:pyridoxal phosphate-dependent aminotransferase [Streptomyces sp. NRRL B-3648]|uniref:pyridoxal phosphate-dependent aminotransferase n=1 Tax=Streptomyces sp. NRRL B-3648 TaxID=1519493 RepID=UPI0006AE161A|nr:aminotransferase class I/II-fold pyridoxal phosphate-dependent enzyme [Streptomyces sp. NRRL B-3648]
MTGGEENPFPSLEMTERATGLRARERLSTNENEFGPAPEVVRAIGAAARECHRYPDCDHHELRRRLGHTLGVPEDHVHIGSGIDGLLGVIGRAFLGPGRTAVTSDATYPTFAYFARAGGATVHLVPYRDARVDTEALVRRATDTGADVVYLADPDNPTGGSLGAPALLRLADRLPARTLLVVDGAYTEYQPPADRPAAGELTGRRMLWLRTFSKAHALAGLRIGYAVGDRALLAALRRGGEHYVVGRVAEAAALAALDAVGHLTDTVRRTAEGRAHYGRRLTELGYTVLEGTTNFVTFRCADTETAAAVAKRLAQSGVFVRHLAAPGLTDCLRMSIGPTAQREAVLAELSRAA